MENYEGKAYYRKLFTIKNEITYQKLNFGAVNYRAKIFLNRHLLGTHEGGYTPFNFNISRFRYYNKFNELIVEVDNKLTETSVPNIIGWKNYGGIYREVYLESPPGISIKNAFIKSIPDLKGNAHLFIDMIVQGEAHKISYGLVGEIISPQGREVLKFGSHIPLKCGESKLKWEGMIREAILWDIGKPNLYQLKLEIFCGDGTKVDEMNYSFGVRKIETKGSKILLNGREIYLKGISRHEDHPQAGKVQSLEIMKKDLKLIKEAGFNAIRTAHYPGHPAFLDLCDREGILIFEEIPAWNTVGGVLKNQEYLKHAQSQMKEEIERDFNHPSVIFWGVGNELEANTEEGRFYIEKMVQFVRSLDSTRLIYHASKTLRNDITTDLLDIVGLNVYYGWYFKDINDIEDLLDFWSKKSSKPIVFTEFGAGSVKGDHSGVGKKWSEENQAYFIKSYYEILRKRPNVAGDFIWCLADFKDPSMVSEPNPLFNTKGILTYEREPKEAYEVVRALNHHHELKYFLPHAKSSFTLPIGYIIILIILILVFLLFILFIKLKKKEKIVHFLLPWNLGIKGFLLFIYAFLSLIIYAYILILFSRIILQTTPIVIPFGSEQIRPYISEILRNPLFLFLLIIYLTIYLIFLNSLLFSLFNKCSIIEFLSSTGKVIPILILFSAFLFLPGLAKIAAIVFLIFYIVAVSLILKRRNNISQAFSIFTQIFVFIFILGIVSLVLQIETGFFNHVYNVLSFY